MTIIENWSLTKALEASPDHDELSLLKCVFDVADPLGDLQRMLPQIEADDLFAANRDNRVENVQPTNFVLYSSPGRFEILVNHFVADLFAMSDNAPHFHHCGFATRILTGGYFHVLYDNDGALDRPDLKIASLEFVRAASGYPIAYDRYHTILTPTDGTLSLLIRGPAKTSRPNIATSAYSRADFRAEWDRMLERLLDPVIAEPKATA